MGQQGRNGAAARKAFQQLLKWEEGGRGAAFIHRSYIKPQMVRMIKLTKRIYEDEIYFFFPLRHKNVSFPEDTMPFISAIPARVRTLTGFDGTPISLYNNP